MDEMNEHGQYPEEVRQRENERLMELRRQAGKPNYRYEEAKMYQEQQRWDGLTCGVVMVALVVMAIISVMMLRLILLGHI